tara:strand:- start:1221 stop:1424 length:204 start_codon:yes stop_codon:yes gene_type:complete
MATYKVNIEQMSYTTIEVEANSKEEAEELVNDMSGSEVEDDAVDRDYSDYKEVLSVDEVSHANQNHK